MYSQVMGKNTVGGTFLGVVTPREGCLLTSFIHAFLCYLSLFRALAWGTRPGTQALPMPALAEKAVSLLWSFGEPLGTPGTFVAGREGQLGASRCEAACLLASRELGRGPFFAIVDLKGLEGHLKVGEVKKKKMKTPAEGMAGS